MSLRGGGAGGACAGAGFGIAVSSTSASSGAAVGRHCARVARLALKGWPGGALTLLEWDGRKQLLCSGCEQEHGVSRKQQGGGSMLHGGTVGMFVQ